MAATVSGNKIVSPQEKLDEISRCHPIRSHPKFKEILKLGNADPMQAQHTLLVYLDMTEVKGWWNVKLVPCVELDSILITGHASRTQSLEVILPQHSDTTLSMAKINDYIRIVERCTNTTGVILGMVDSESNIVYYRLTGGLVPPERPEVIETKKRRRNRKFQKRKVKFVKHSEASNVAALAKAESLHLTLGVSPDVEMENTGDTDIDTATWKNLNPIFSDNSISSENDQEFDEEL